MTKKRSSGFPSAAGLTLGLDALADVMGTAQAQRLPLQQIAIQPGHNPRGQYDQQAFQPERLAGLTESVSKEGILQPIWVRSLGAQRYGLIAGERRYRAAQLAGLTEIPVLVFEADEERASLLALIENGQREELHLLDETFAGFKALEARTGLAGNDLINYLNQVRKGRAEDVHQVEQFLKEVFGTGLSVWVQFRAKVFALTPQELEAVWKGEMEFSVAVALTRLPEGEIRSALLEQALQEKLTATAVKELIEGEQTTSRSTFQEQISKMKKTLPKLSRLEGQRAKEAEKLLRQLEALLEGS
ncbi:MULTISPECIES: ParB/RepB/Spo0J family partition protein [Deinococcus]|uniref:ParB-like nuclease domain family protein n=2 Tax=Deinococcus TaxID=1298 RepID=H8H354_DEIGI|nr:ParB/RepB/Spo0J family partition protein [Deinococcus gobiensis]AFD27951.1 ParB-like nuclease domain family protein [Deinococcus gobiensis I-0]